MKNKKTYSGSSPLKLAPIIPFLATTIPAAVNFFGSMSARKKAKADAEKYGALGDEYLKKYEEFDPRVQNPYEDLTVNRQEAEFIREQQEQASADTLYNLKGAAGGAGIASLATAMSRQGAMNAQRAAASIGKQERQNQLLEKQFAGTEDRRVKTFNQQRIQNVGSMYMGKAGVAEQAQAAATQQMYSAVGDIAGGLTSFAGAGGFSGAGGASSRYYTDEGGNIWDGNNIIGRTF